MNDSLTGKVAVVSGGARGLGREIAKGLAEAGADLVVGDVQEEAGRLAASELSNLGVRSVFIHADVGLVADCRGLIQGALRQLGRLDILVNNAAICPSRSIPETTEEEWDRVLAVNLKGPFFCSQAAAAILKEQGAGRIINISSVAAYYNLGANPTVHYSCSKSGLITMSRNFAGYLAPFGVTVNTVAPGPMMTDLSRVWGEKWAANQVKMIPMGRLGTTREVAPMVVFLASDAGAFITGATMYVDGGLLMR